VPLPPCRAGHDPWSGGHQGPGEIVKRAARVSWGAASVSEQELPRNCTAGGSRESGVARSDRDGGALLTHGQSVIARVVTAYRRLAICRPYGKQLNPAEDDASAFL